jgi:lysophospholipase
MTRDSSSIDGLLAPSGAIATWLETSDGPRLRAARWTRGAAVKGTVAILQGRAEFIEKYCEVITELLERGFEVVALDWRGQGLSDRLLRNRGKGHVLHFAAYLNDLDALREQVLEPFCPRPWFALGHSMGGAILLDQAHAGRSPFARLVLVAPMIALSGIRWPHATHRLARTLRLLGLGRFFIPGGSGRSYMLKGFSGNVLTSDPERYARTAAFIATDPNLAIGDPTIRWVDAAFALMRRFEAPELPVRISTPTLILAAGRDKVTDTAAIELFASRLKCGRCITLPGAEHELLMERELFRERFWAAFDAFVPGQPEQTEAAIGTRPVVDMGLADASEPARAQLASASSASCAFVSPVTSVRRVG